MIDIEKWREIFASLGRHKLRTFLTAFSVWWGIFMLTILLGAGNGLFNSATKNFEDQAFSTFWIWSYKTSKEYKGLPLGRFISLENKDIKAVNQSGLVNHASPVNWLQSKYTVTYNNKTLAYRPVGIFPDFQYIEYPGLEMGRFINQTDEEKSRKVCVIGKTVYDGVFKDDENPINKHIQIGGIDFKIVGMFEKQNRWDNERIYIPNSTVQKIEGNKRLGNITVELGDISVEQSVELEKKIRATIALQHQVAPDDEQAIGIHNNVEQFQEIRTVMTLISSFIWFVGIGSIIAGVIGVSNIMLIIVKERTKEIGIRKALGATPRSILSMILTEALVLTGIAGYIGLASGLAIIYGLNKALAASGADLEFFHNPEVNVWTVTGALIVLVISGVLAGLIPALQAVRINPVVAMKS